LAGLCADFDKIWTGVSWLIIRNPYGAGQLVPGKQHTYALKTSDFLAVGLPEIIVSYSLIDVEKRILEVIDVLPVQQNSDLGQTA
jgi:hypothetical protein